MLYWTLPHIADRIVENSIHWTERHLIRYPVQFPSLILHHPQCEPEVLDMLQQIPSFQNALDRIVSDIQHICQLQSANKIHIYFLWFLLTKRFMDWNSICPQNLRGRRSLPFTHSQLHQYWYLCYSFHFAAIQPVDLVYYRISHTWLSYLMYFRKLNTFAYSNLNSFK